MLHEIKAVVEGPVDFFWPDANGDLQPFVATGIERDVIDAIGVDRAGALFLQFGGAPIYLGERDNGGDLRAVLGEECVAKLTEYFRAGQIGRVPLANEFLIKLFASKNWSKVNIARVVRVADETVRRTLWAQKKQKATMECKFAVRELAIQWRGETASPGRK